MLCSLPRARIQRLVFSPLTIVFHVINKMYYVHLKDKKKKKQFPNFLSFLRLRSISMSDTDILHSPLQFILFIYEVE